MDEPREPNLESFRVVLVEDHPGDAELALEWLEQSPRAFVAIRAGSLARAVELLKGDPIDVVALDLNLPDSSGLGTVDLVRSCAPDIPIVVLTGRVDSELCRAALRIGAVDVVDKNEPNARRVFTRSVLYAAERGRADHHLRQVSRLLDTSTDAVILVDGPGRVRFVNDAALRLFGRARADLQSETLGFSSPDGVPVELRIPHPEGERIGEMRVVSFDPKVGGYLATIRDVTEQRRLEMQLVVSDRMVAMGTLAAGVAHEINTPLTATIANLDLLSSDLAALAMSTPIPAHLVDQLSDARSAANQVRQVVRDLKVLSRPEEERRGPVDVVRVVESTLRLAWAEVLQRATLVRDLRPVPLVDGNESRLSQVLLNLLVNAAQAIPAGNSETNRVRVSTGLAPDGRVAVEIEDTGCGIPEAMRERVFAPFFTTKLDGNGTGLGLAISRRIVASLGGELSFRSEVGLGTTFTLLLRPAGSSTEAAAERSVVPPVRRGRVLVVDDEPMVVKVAARALADSHDVVTQTNPVAALELLRHGERFDVILCDLMMPGLTGMEFRDRLLLEVPEQEPRIVFMTGGAFSPEARSFLDRVSNAKIDKPFTVRDLQTLVNGRIA